MKGQWNRSARKSGGDRRAFIPTAPLTRDDVELIRQEQEIRKEFGEEGVRRFWEEIEKREKEQSQ